MPPGHPPKRPKVDPSRSQEAIFSILNFDLILGSIFIPFWLPKCLPLGTLLATKIFQKNSRSPQDSPRSPQDGPKIGQDGPRAPKTTPRCPQGAPKTSQDPPKTPQDRLKTPQDAPKRPQNRPKKPEHRSWMASFA